MPRARFQQRGAVRTSPAMSPQHAYMVPVALPRILREGQVSRQQPKPVIYQEYVGNRPGRDRQDDASNAQGRSSQERENGLVQDQLGHTGQPASGHAEPHADPCQGETRILKLPLFMREILSARLRIPFCSTHLYPNVYPSPWVSAKARKQKMTI